MTSKRYLNSTVKWILLLTPLMLFAIGIMLSVLQYLLHPSSSTIVPVVYFTFLSCLWLLALIVLHPLYSTGKTSSGRKDGC